MGKVIIKSIVPPAGSMSGEVAHMELVCGPVLYGCVEQLLPDIRVERGKVGHLAWGTDRTGLRPGDLVYLLHPERDLSKEREPFTMPDLEALARIDIDRQLDAAGWVVQDRAKMFICAGPGVAIREVTIPGAGEADYLLVAGGKAIGILEAKPVDSTLKGVEIQTANYAQGLPKFVPSWTLPLPMLYESTGKETQFTNLLDPEPRSRRVFMFHRPETLVEWAKAETTLIHPNGKQAAEESVAYRTGAATLTGRLHRRPEHIAGEVMKLTPEAMNSVLSMKFLLWRENAYY
jgi:hypothetical protein